MELELAADPGTAGNLGRLKVLSANRDGRARSQSVKIVWHDDPEHALLADGLTLAEQRGEWRLERIGPGPLTWLPGQPVPVLDPAPDLTALPAPLAPLAAFEGRRTSSVHRFGDASVTVAIEKGILRAVTAEHPVARILLSGDDEAVRTTALLISGAMPVSVPVTSLAAEGIALATGRDASPRHHGAPVLPDPPPSIEHALAHILGHLTDVILANAPVAIRPDDAGTVAVHQMRVAVRRARSAIAVFKPTLRAGILDAANDGLKELGSKLGPTRDWDVFVDETIPAIQRALPADARLERLSAAAVRRRRECRTALAAYLAGPAFRDLGIELAWFLAASLWSEPPAIDQEMLPAAGDELPRTVGEFAAEVLQQRWKKLVSSGKRMDDLDIAGMHDVRLRAKRARYAAEMFATLHRGKAANRFIERLSKLQQRLGVLNDGAVATQLLAELGGAGGRHANAAGVVAGFMAARAEQIRPRIIRAFKKFRRQPAYWT